MPLSLRLLACACAVILPACVTSSLPPETAEHRIAAVHLHQAERKSSSTETRAAEYLAAAREATKLLDSQTASTDARRIYNQAVTDLAVLLRSSENGRLWNQPLTLSNNGTAYRLAFAPGNRDGAWNPAAFSTLVPAADYQDKDFKHLNVMDGIGGTLVGWQNPNPPPKPKNPYPKSHKPNPALNNKGKKKGKGPTPIPNNPAPIVAAAKHLDLNKVKSTKGSLLLRA